MNDIFVDMIDIIIIIYLDDILIYSDNISEHKSHVWEVLCRLRTNGLFAHADKCEIHATSCEYHICCPQKALPCPHTKSKLSETGWNPRKSRMSNISLVLPI